MATYILLIEGVGADSSESLCRHLEGQDYQLLTANTPETAGEQITTWPDLIVLDHSNTLPFDPDRIISRNFLKIPLVVVGNKAAFNGEITVDTIMVAPITPNNLPRRCEKHLLSSSPALSACRGWFLTVTLVKFYVMVRFTP